MAHAIGLMYATFPLLLPRSCFEWVLVQGITKGQTSYNKGKMTKKEDIK